jgi:hypothetical protein
MSRTLLQTASVQLSDIDAGEMRDRRCGRCGTEISLVRIRVQFRDIARVLELAKLIGAQRKWQRAHWEAGASRGESVSAPAESRPSQPGVLVGR